MFLPSSQLSARLLTRLGPLAQINSVPSVSRSSRRMPSYFYSGRNGALGERYHKISRGYASYSHYPGGDSYRSAQRVIWAIIGLNSVVFGAWTYAKIENNLPIRRRLYENFTLSKINMAAGRYWTVVTSAFSHILPVHFAFNMLAFHALAGILAFIPGIGGGHILAVGLGSAISGSLAWLYQKTDTSANYRVIETAVGASGMVMGIGAAAACLMPFAPMQVMFIPVNIPLWALTLLYVGVDTYFLNSNSIVGHSAHLGGAVFGALYYFVALRRFGGVWQLLKRGRRGGGRH